MESAPTPLNERARLAGVRSLGILDTPPEERFDRITRLATRLLSTPVALLCFVDQDRLWFKSRQNWEYTQASREASFCAHAIVNDDVLVVRDATADARFEDNPLVTEDPNIRFYAGCAIRSSQGHHLGTLCVIDREPRELSDEDKLLLCDLTRMVELELATIDLALTDELTGLMNRRGYQTIGAQVVELSKRTEIELAACFIDLDDMKSINDAYGHEAGDDALKALATLLRESFRDSDVIARVGGDEFCILLAGSASAGAAVAETRLHEAIGRYNERSGAPYRLSVSVGRAAVAAGAITDLAALTDLADRAMYVKKLSKVGSGTSEPPNLRTSL